MTRQQIITELKKFFDIRELVCNHTYQKFGAEVSWQFLDTEILHTLLVVRRDILKMGMVCNNYHVGGKYSERGLRCNICSIPKGKTLAGQIYLSAHPNGKGLDFTVMGMTAEQARRDIENHAILLPYTVRMEDAVSWLHIDCYDPMNGRKISRFKG